MTVEWCDPSTNLKDERVLREVEWCLKGSFSVSN